MARDTYDLRRNRYSDLCTTSCSIHTFGSSRMGIINKWIFRGCKENYNELRKGPFECEITLRASQGEGDHVPLFPMKIYSCSLVPQKYIKVFP